MSRPAAPAPDPAAIRRALDVLLAPGQVTELRALDVSTPSYSRAHTERGYFDNWDRLAAAAAQLAPHAGGVYIVPNPVNPALLARTANRIKAVTEKDASTTDTDVTTRRWLPIDVDPRRPAGISSTEAEHAAARLRAQDVRADLAAAGWPDPVDADSGNGAHLLYRVELPRDDGGLVQRVLEALAFRFDDPVCAVDQTVYNPARIWKLYGTLARKGDHIPERPHRLPQLLHVPPDLAPVPLVLLEALAASAPRDPAPTKRTRPAGGFDLAAWIADHGLDVHPAAPWQGGSRWVFPVCPWNPDHRNRSAYIVQFPSGAIAAGCHHNGCVGQDWQALRALYEPEASAGPRDAPPRAKAAATWTRLDTVRRDRVEWIWRRYVPRRKLVVIEGDPGLGKSTIVLDLAARVTRHRNMPDETATGLDGPADVLLLSAEDGLADTIKPKLEEMGADLTRVHFWQGFPDGESVRPPSLPADVDALGEKITETSAALVIIDPLSAYLGGHVDTYRDHHIRRALAPLAALAERLGVTIVVLRHLVKSPTSENPIHRGGGSVAIGAAARVVLVVGHDPDDPTQERRVLAVTKNNLAPLAPSLAYVLSGPEDRPAVVQWQGTTAHTASSLLALNPEQAGDTRIARHDAADFLRQMLATGRRPVTEIFEEAKKQEITAPTLRRAKKELGILAGHTGYGQDVCWYWEWPPAATADSAAETPPGGEHLKDTAGAKPNETQAPALDAHALGQESPASGTTTARDPAPALASALDAHPATGAVPAALDAHAESVSEHLTLVSGNSGRHRVGRRSRRKRLGRRSAAPLAEPALG
ncbi:MAG TPA: AAA family ATPase [Chloroflexota bacterium]